MRESGADRPGFELIVAAGPHGALPHATPRDVAVKRGDMVVIDWGAEVDGYRSDCTRTIAAGEPSDEAREVYELVLAAELAGVEAVRAGAGGRDVDAAARAVIEAGGHGEHFGHGLGHGVGIEIHEAPRLSMRSDDRARERKRRHRRAGDLPPGPVRGPDRGPGGGRRRRLRGPDLAR